MIETMKPIQVDLKVKVEVTEYARPNAKKIVHIVQLHNDHWLKNEMVGREGLRFTLEHLEKGVACVSLENPKFGDYLIELVPSEFWQEAVPKILADFHKSLYDIWVRGFD